MPSVLGIGFYFVIWAIAGIFLSTFVRADHFPKTMGNAAFGGLSEDLSVRFAQAAVPDDLGRNLQPDLRLLIEAAAQRGLLTLTHNNFGSSKSRGSFRYNQNVIFTHPSFG